LVALKKWRIHPNDEIEAEPSPDVSFPNQGEPGGGEASNKGSEWPIRA
jgi:hypothetical protein